jgi:hypothetical protein
MIFSLPSILLTILWTAARLDGEGAAREAVFFEIRQFVGGEGAANWANNETQV